MKDFVYFYSKKGKKKEHQNQEFFCEISIIFVFDLMLH